MKYIIWKVKNSFSKIKYKFSRVFFSFTFGVKSIWKVAIKLIVGTVAVFAVIAALVFVSTITVREVRCRQNRLTREEVLYDFDYLLTAIEENFPFLNMLYRRDGVDLLALGQEVREEIANGPETMCIRCFWEIMRYDFFYYARQIGHLRMVGEPERGRLVNNIREMNVDILEDRHLTHLWNIMTNPPTHPCFTRIDFPEPRDVNRQMLRTEIIEEERIVYLRFYHLGRWWNRVEQIEMQNFYRIVQNFDHLIIDIRGNPGGNTGIFDEMIRPILNRTHSVQFHHFFKGGEYNINFYTMLENFPVIWGYIYGEPFYISQVTYLFFRRYVPYYVLEDLSYFNYRGSGRRIVQPVHHTFEAWHWPFRGRVWMLVDENVTSAANQVAAFYKYSGFATLVGETTRGISGSPATESSNHFVLPNTGIIVRYDPAYVTTAFGRPLEMGIEPHYFNRPGLCALETVLEMINEGNN